MLNNEMFIEVGFRIAGRPHTGWSQYETNVSHLLHSKILNRYQRYPYTGSDQLSL